MLRSKAVADAGSPVRSKKRAPPSYGRWTTPGRLSPAPRPPDLPEGSSRKPPGAHRPRQPGEGYHSRTSRPETLDAGTRMW